MYPFPRLMEATVYKGVTQTTGGYIATIGNTRIGTYDSEIEAALVYDLTIVATLGDFATDRNFPDLDENDLVATLDNDLTNA